MIMDDFSRFKYIYDPIGFAGDLTARFRAWEGAIDASAMIQYLFGLELDAPNNRIALAPHLPSGWGFARMEKARLADNTFDISVSDQDNTRTLAVDNLASGLTIDAVVSVLGEIASVKVNGKAVTPAIETEWGLSRAYLPGLHADENTPLTVEVIRK